MRVTLATHGGQAAGINLRLPPRVVDSATLPEPAAEKLSQLVAAAKAVEVSAASDQHGRDAMSYTITVEDSGRSTVLAQSDVTMTRQFAELLAWLQEHTASR
jgi:Emfourin